MHYTKGMIFGVFDTLHEGHKYFLSRAQELCDDLVVVVARDDTAKVQKGRAPKQSEDERVKAVSLVNPSLTVVLGDRVKGDWNVLGEHTPDIVILGYDQQAIAEKLLERAIPYIYVDAHEPERYKSSLLNG